MRRLSYLRYAGLAAVMVLGLIAVSATPAHAQFRYSRRSMSIALNNGYQLGFGAGSNDRASGRRFSPNRHRAFRDGDSGFSGSGFRNRSDYRVHFRRGFERGYRDGFHGLPRVGFFNGSNRDFRNVRGRSRSSRDNSRWRY